MRSKTNNAYCEMGKSCLIEKSNEFADKEKRRKGKRKMQFSHAVCLC